MAQVTRVLEAIRVFFGRLTTSQRLLLGSLGVLMVMTLFLVRQYTETPVMTPLLATATSEEQTRAAGVLAASAIPHRVDEAGRLLVPPGRRQSVMAMLAEAGALPADNALTFDSLPETQSWTKSYDQNRQLEQIALQNELAQIISKMQGVRSARVVVDAPQKRSLGQPATKPTASVTVVSAAGINQGAADAIAALVASSRAGLTVDRVKVIDATTNRYFRARSETDMSASSNLELAAAIEERKHRQLYDWLSAYIPGVIVVVHAQVDTTRQRTQRTEVLPEGKGSTSMLNQELTTAREEADAVGAGEPGVRSNAGLDIYSGGAERSTSTERTGEASFDNVFGQEVSSIDDPRGVPTKINVVVNVPRAYFVDLWRRRQGAPADAAQAGPPPEPTDVELDPIVTGEVERIRREVETAVDTAPAGGPSEAAPSSSVQVSMIPVEPLTPFGPGGAAGSAAMMGGRIAGMATDDLVKTAVLGVFALLAMGLVVATALKSSKRQALPTAQEIAGLPPALDTDEALVGEASATEAELTGMELSEQELVQKHLMDQVGELVKSDPEEAAAIVGRWITEEV